MKWIYMMLFFLGAFFFVPSQAFAQTAIHAQAVGDATAQILTADRAIGPPDGRHATLRSANDTLVLDFGESVGSVSDVTLFFRRLSPITNLTVRFLDADMTVLDQEFASISSGTSRLFPYQGDVPYRFIELTQVTNSTINIDAAETVDIGMPSEEETEEAYQGPAQEVIDPLAGTIVQALDDGDPTTELDGRLYMLDANNDRYLIPDDSILASWGYSREDIEYVGVGSLAAMEFKGTISYRPGTFLLRNSLTKELFMIGGDGRMHPVAGDEAAERLYGMNWRRRIVNVSELDLRRYTRGDILTGDMLPNGTFIETVSGVTYYVDSGMRYRVNTEQQERLRLSRWLMESDLTQVELSKRYENGGKLASTDGLRLPF